MTSTWEEFYAKTPKPADLEENKVLLKNFIDRFSNTNKKVVVITSGGTTVPIEHNTVRFVDNFSAGNRGAISAEYFLEQDYAVIFVYRLKSLEPFSRHFMGNKFLDMLELTSEDSTDSVKVTPEHSNKVANILKNYKKTKERLLQLTFTTLSDYLWLLRSVCQAISGLEDRAIVYLAAAVSDFYIPPNEMSEHKIPSTEAPSIHLRLVPKVLKPLVNLWIPKSFVVSFKLETDERVLISKARKALENYSHSLVIANILQSRRQQVVFVTKDCDYTLRLTDEELKNGEEIERLIVENLVVKHVEWMEKAH
ncbi:hypothetical protein TKK_0001435 [Trichogramma kaykai]|uniref:DNA/pantothenate metabolism flavoprotein C-terminal domain-containing protein n=1 Tax=Trichogramma kaykai TaxID=54128 RepID=A0ABD2X376_9HYME